MTAGETDRAISIVRANEASCEDLEARFGKRGAASSCQCQRYKLRPRETFAKFPYMKGSSAMPASRGRAVSCLLTRPGFRKRGIGRALVRAAVDFARERGARAIEGYPIMRSSPKRASRR
jgi:GNAT superfamily N-acetyltransferase